MTPANANGDGLIDIVVTLGLSMDLYMNEGDRFTFAHSLEERLSGGQEGMPVAQNLTESGEDEFLFSTRDAVRAMELTQPSTGFLIRADDGRGNAISFTYKRAPATARLADRARVIASMTHTSTGVDDVVYAYDYANPVVHPAGHFLVGFGAVTRGGPDGTREQQYFHDAELRNLPTLVRHAWAAETDERGTVATFEQVTQHTYQQVRYLGVRLRRPSQVTSGIRKLGGPLKDVHTTRFLQYARGVCATQSELQSQHGKLASTIELATVAALNSDLHCFTKTETLTGTHTAHPAFDFVESRTIDRNDLGQPTRFTSPAGDQSLVLQEIGYDDRHRLKTVAAPGHGTTELVYDSFDRLHQVIAPDGVVTEAGRDTRADLVQALTVARGQARHEQSFRYDDFLRLFKSWDSFRGGSETEPLEKVAYQFPSASALGATRVSSQFDVNADGRIETVAWIAADGTALASGTLAPDEAGVTAWVVSDLVEPSRDLLTTTSYVAPRFSGNWQTTTAEALRTGALELGTTASTGAGTPRRSATLLQSERDLAGRVIPPIVSTTDVWYLVTDAGMTQHSRAADNDDLVSTATTDGSGNVLAIANPDGDTTQFAYDASGRLRRVTLADGTQHTVSFDGFGRPSEIARDRLGRIVFAYESTPVHTDRVATKKFFGDGEIATTRTCEYTYDSIDRIQRERHRRTADNAIVDYDYGYDGAGTTATGQLGRQTEVKGPSYRRQTVFNPDGTTQKVIVTLGTWRQITTRWIYNAAGKVLEETRQIANAATGALVHQTILQHEHDPHGRLSKIFYDGQELAEFTYDEFNRVSSAALDPASGPSQTLALLYDEETRARAGTWIDQGTWNAAVEWSFDERGLIDLELLTLNGIESLRDYTYDDRGFLTESVDPAGTGAGTTQYQYDTTGLLSHIADQAGDRALGSGRDRTIGGVPYRYDTLGRLIRKGDLTLIYGPQGHLVRARRGTQTWNFVYDEGGSRVLKLLGNTPVAGFVDGIYIEPDHVIEPFRVAGALVGVFVDGAFEPLATDPRGSIWVEPSGAKNLPSPYGVRAQHPQLAPALDYVEKGFDADLGFVRMGVRDYDPFLGQFSTPDPLFLEAIEKCVESPTECNLFGYAKSNPVSFVDPTGMCVSIGCWIARAVSAAGSEYPIGDPVAPFLTVPVVTPQSDSLARAQFEVAAKVNNALIAAERAALDALETDVRIVQAAGLAHALGSIGSSYSSGMGGGYGPSALDAMSGAGETALARSVARARVPAATGAGRLFQNKFPSHTLAPPIQTFTPQQVARSTFTRRLNYVVIENGQLMLGRSNDLPGGGHIDLAGGAPVQAAGEVHIVNGRIRMIDNASGHYLPSGAEAQRAAEAAFSRAGLEPGSAYVEKIWSGSAWVPK